MALSSNGKGLLGLPSEIRTTIYKYLFYPCSVTVDSHEVVRRHGDRSNTCVATPFARSSQILRTSKIIWQEASPIFFDNLTVFFTRHEDAIDCLSVCGARQGHPTSKNIRCLTIDFDSYRLNNLEFQDLLKLNLPNLKSARLTCSAYQWITKENGNSMYDENPDFKTCSRTLGMVAEGLRSASRLERKVDRSLPGRKVVFELS